MKWKDARRLKPGDRVRRAGKVLVINRITEEARCVRLYVADDQGVEWCFDPHDVTPF